jgi:hypothetical protein
MIKIRVGDLATHYPYIGLSDIWRHLPERLTYRRSDYKRVMSGQFPRKDCCKILAQTGLQTHRRQYDQHS